MFQSRDGSRPSQLIVVTSSGCSSEDQRRDGGETRSSCNFSRRSGPERVAHDSLASPSPCLFSSGARHPRRATTCTRCRDRALPRQRRYAAGAYAPSRRAGRRTPPRRRERKERDRVKIVFVSVGGSQGRLKRGFSPAKRGTEVRRALEINGNHHGAGSGFSSDEGKYPASSGRVNFCSRLLSYRVKGEERGERCSLRRFAQRMLFFASRFRRALSFGRNYELKKSR